MAFCSRGKLLDIFSGSVESIVLSGKTAFNPSCFHLTDSPRGSSAVDCCFEPARSNRTQTCQPTAVPAVYTQLRPIFCPPEVLTRPRPQRHHVHSQSRHRALELPFPIGVGRLQLFIHLLGTQMVCSFVRPPLPAMRRLTIRGLNPTRAQFVASRCFDIRPLPWFQYHAQPTRVKIQACLLPLLTYLARQISLTRHPSRQIKAEKCPDHPFPGSHRCITLDQPSAHHLRMLGKELGISGSLAARTSIIQATSRAATTARTP